MAGRVFSENQTITATSPSTNTIDLGALTDDRGNPLKEYGPEDGKIRVLVLAGSALGGTSPSIQIRLQDSADDNSFTDVLSGKTLTAVPEDNELWNISLPPGVRRYIRLNYVLGGTSPSITIGWAGLAWGGTS